MNVMKKVKGAGFRILIILGMLLPVVLVSGCSHEVYQNGIPDYSSGKGHSPDITKRDLDRFASSIKPLNSQVAPFYRRAIHFQKRGKHNLAITELKKALQADPGSAKVYNAMGISYDHLRLYDRAIVCYQKALALEPDLAYTYNNLGYS